MKSKIKFFLLLVVVLFSACSKSETEPQTTKSSSKSIVKFTFTKVDNPSLTEDVEGIIDGTNIKLVLYGTSKTSLKPTISHTGTSINAVTATNFTDPEKYTVTAEDGTTTIYTVTVESRDVYVAGYDFDDVKKKYFACYWKNGVQTKLTDATTGAYATSVIVVGNDVYVSGFIDFSSSGSAAVYWKNGTKVVLNEVLLKSSYAYQMTSSGNDFYVVGSIDKTVVCWKNGIAANITDGSAYAYASAIFVSGSDVYAAGETVNSIPYEIATLWKNGVKTTLSNGTSRATANFITVVGSDVYVAGEEGSLATYWKNGVKTQFGTGGAHGMAFSGADIYVAGIDKTGVKTVAAYWKNGIKNALSSGVNDANAFKISVVGNDVYVAGNEKKNGTTNNATYWINAKAYTLSTKASFASDIFVK